jgi:hypothetical protein
MTTPEQTPDTDQDVQELTDENLEEVSGGGVALAANWLGPLSGNSFVAALDKGRFTGQDVLRQG